MQGILLACEVSKISTLVDGSLNIVLNTQELSNGKAAEVLGLRKKPCAVYLSEKAISEAEQHNVDKIDVEIGMKTPSQRLRSLLFLNWQRDPDGYKDSESYYRAKMEKIIEQLKARLNP